MKQTITKIFISWYQTVSTFAGRISFTHKLLIACLVLVISYTVAFFDKSVEFTYAGTNCTERATFLPGLFRSSNDSYRVELRDELKVGQFALMSQSTCLAPLKPPVVGKQARVAVSLFGSPLFRQAYMVNPEQLPVFNLKSLSTGVAVSRPLELTMSGSDQTHSYKLLANTRSVTCSPGVEAVSCDVSKLDLKQGTKYDIAVDRYFDSDKVATAVKKSITTLSPVSILDSSIKSDEIVYSKPTSIEIRTDKPLAKAIIKLYRLEGDKRIEVTQTVVLGETGVKVTPTDQLPRSSSYQLVMTDVEASDGSSLLESSYILPFTVSGGPKVTGVNIGRTGVSQSATVVVTFDQPLSPTQDIGPLVGFKGGVAGISKQNNQIILKFSSMPLCGDFSITLSKDIASNYDIGGDSAWNYSSRTICYTVITIGYTVKGRPITAYQFGTGSTTILYVGTTHGNESGTYSLMSTWIDELEANARNIPADKKIVVVPAINRDGLVGGTRRNASNVDLNRNFPTADWKADVTMPGGELIVGGGGASPLSEPESRAISNFTLALSPRLVLTYHSTGSLVSANEAGISVGASSLYASLSGYWNAPKSSNSSTFEYDTTGAYEDWLYEQPGIAALLVELSSHSNAEFSRNKSAMWEMMK